MYSPEAQRSFLNSGKPRFGWRRTGWRSRGCRQHPAWSRRGEGMFLIKQVFGSGRVPAYDANSG
jgi:hypothetical protein